MREHLYRGKRVDNGEWVYGDLIKDYLSGQYFIHPYGDSANESDKVGEEGCLRFFSFEVIPETICEYTGLTNKNGKKIFEGDIVQAPSNLAGTEFYIGTIGFGNFSDYSDNIYTGFFIKWKNVPEYSTLRQSIIWWRDEQDRFLNIIGNIFDNPELLEK